MAKGFPLKKFANCTMSGSYYFIRESRWPFTNIEYYKSLILLIHLEVYLNLIEIITDAIATERLIQ